MQINELYLKEIGDNTYLVAKIDDGRTSFYPLPLKEIFLKPPELKYHIPLISDYDPTEEKLDKYEIILKGIKENINIKRGMIMRDICCHSSHKWSTAGLGLDLGFHVHSWGNKIDFMVNQENLNIYYCKDVTLLSFDKIIGKNNLGCWAILSLIDPCGFIDPEFVLKCVKHSYYTILTITNTVCRAIGHKAINPNNKLFGKSYLGGKGALIRYIDILIKEAKRRGYNAKILGKTHDHNRLIEFKNEAKTEEGVNE